MKYIIDKKLDLSNDAGFKARIDIINICNDLGYKYIAINYSGKVFKKIINLFKSIILEKIEKNSLVIIQYPLNIKIIKILLKKSKKMKCNTICIIHDIDVLRNKLGDIHIKKEIALLNNFDYVISHNNAMTRWLIENGMKNNIIELKLFDYLCEKSKDDNEYKFDKFSISYATGMLGKDKSLYLYKIKDIINDELKLFLYGNIEENLIQSIKENSNIYYKGSFPADKLVNIIQGDFGLIWDSSDLYECNGNFGEYMKYNNPHKLSMYISAEIPVIVWNKSAIANFVEDNNIGICIESLSELPQKLKNIDYNKYKKMKENIKNISIKVRTGEYIKSVIKKIEEIERQNIDII